MIIFESNKHKGTYSVNGRLNMPMKEWWNDGEGKAEATAGEKNCPSAILRLPYTFSIQSPHYPTNKDYSQLLNYLANTLLDILNRQFKQRAVAQTCGYRDITYAKKITDYLAHLLYNTNHICISKSKRIQQTVSQIILLTSSFLLPSCLL
jgi:hypothetical protein